MADLMVPIKHVLAAGTQTKELRIPGSQTAARSTQLSTITTLGIVFTLEFTSSGATTIRVMSGSFEYKRAVLSPNQVQTWILQVVDVFSSADFTSAFNAWNKV